MRGVLTLTLGVFVLAVAAAETPRFVVDDDAYVERLWKGSEKLIAKAGL